MGSARQRLAAFAIERWVLGGCYPGRLGGVAIPSDNNCERRCNGDAILERRDEQRECLRSRL